jgi:ElaB/YqjD/DUF883 family membrane-anchored ribosome-binding protein
MRKLQIEYSRKEKLEKLISNLDTLKTEGQVTAKQYNSIKDNYEKLLSEAVKAVENTKGTLKKNLEKKQDELKNLNQSLENLGVRFKIGEMPEADFHKANDRIQRTIQARQREITDLQNLLNTKSSSDVGGYVEVKIEAPKGLTLAIEEMLPASLSGSGEISSGFVTKPSLISLILGVVIFISVFLPWVSADFGLGMTETANGMENGWGTLALIMGIICVLFSFIAIPKIRGVGLIASGILAIIGVIAYWFSIRGELGMFQEIISPSFGLFITALAAIGVLITGIAYYRRPI